MGLSPAGRPDPPVCPWEGAGSKEGVQEGLSPSEGCSKGVWAQGLGLTGAGEALGEVSGAGGVGRRGRVDAQGLAMGEAGGCVGARCP